MEQTTGYYNTFVVKIWCDKNSEQMRGQIQHASSQEQAYFGSLNEMQYFILNHLNPPADYTIATNSDGGLSSQDE